jgi:RND superfamily putative drug exporter
MKQSLAKLVSGKWSGAAIFLVAFVFVGLVFGPLASEKAETAPTVGLPADNETVLVDEALKGLPSQDGTAAVVVYRTTDGSAMTEEQQTWIIGEKKVFTPPFPPGADPIVTYENGANEKFVDFSSIEVEIGGETVKVVPAATLSDDESTAVITVPMTEIKDEAFCDAVPAEAGKERAKCSTVQLADERMVNLRAEAKSGIPAGLETATTGPEAFLVDVSGVFKGANFALLGTTALVVMLLLLITYRSPVLWAIPLLTVGVADAISGDLATKVASWFGITNLDGSVTGILSVLVFGAGTDYALLLISRYREELFTEGNKREAMRKAWIGAAPAIFASGATVILALSTLAIADLEGTRALGIACATGVLVAMVGALFVLPVLLVSFGTWIFWPVRPKVGAVSKVDSGLWAKLGRGVSKRPIAVTLIGVIILGGLAAGAGGIKIGLSSTEQFLKKPEAVVGQEYLAKAFAAGTTTPSTVIANNDKVDEVVAAAKAVDGVSSVEVAKNSDGEAIANDSITKIDVVLDAESRSDAAYATITALREAVHNVDGAEAKVGGLDAQSLDVKNAYAKDQGTIIPIILALVFLVLVLLLRSLVAPILLLLTVVGSFFASMGAGWLLFVSVFNFPALDLSVFLFSFLFLVALGVDYNIFLVTRAKEESEKLGLREGMIKALASTGGVITSAGILLAAVFAVLGVLPLVALAQIGVIVCIGVLLDTLLVRTVIVPALAFLAGEKFWWPSKSKKVG